MAAHPRSALLLVVMVAAAALCSRTTSAFLCPSPSSPSLSVPRLSSSYYDDMDYTAQRNQVQEKYVQGDEKRRGRR